MASQLMAHTQIACHLSLNIVVNDNGNARLVTLPLLPLTGLFFLLWSIHQAVESFGFELAMIIDEITSRLSVIGKLLGIGFSSVVWGMGL